MKITIILLIATIMQVSATGFAQRVTLNEKKITLDRVFSEIRKQTGYDVLWESEKLKGSSTIDAQFKNASLEEVMNKCLEGKPLIFIIQENTVVIKEKEPSFLGRILDRFNAIDVRGRVVDEEGKPLPGATVRIKSTGKSVSTNAKGEFYFEKVEEGAVLVVSFIGYLSKEARVGKEMGEIVLEASDSKLDEIQVIAYGTTTMRLSTGNVTTVTAAEIEKQPVNNPLYTLQGRVPGLQINPTTGLAGGAVNLQLRGQNSITFVNPPLIVIDGMPIVNNIVGLGHRGYMSPQNDFKDELSALSFINPNDVESISVLKDAQATSIYGSRGANGVILIATKKGKSGEARVDVDLKSGWSDVSRKIELLNTQQYLEFRKETLKNSGMNVFTAPYNADFLKKGHTADVNTWDQKRYTDWQEELLGNTARLTEFQGTVSGGTSVIKYVLSGNYRKENTVFAGENADQKGSARMSISGASSNQRFKTSLNALFMYNRNTLPGIDFTNLAITLPPNAPNIYTTDGKLNWEVLPSGASTWDNPYAQPLKTYNATVKNLQLSGDISYQFFKNLDFKTQVGFGDLRGNSFYKSDPLAARPPEELDANTTAAARFNNTDSQNISVEPQLTYSFNLGWGEIDFLAGASYQSSVNKNDFVLGTGAVNDNVLQNYNSFSGFRGENNSSNYKYAALFGRLGYNWKNKYRADFSMRRDGSSRFGPGNQFGTFGSGALAWIFTEEQFFKNAIPVLSYGKVRVSYGSSGNDGIGDYRYLERYTALSQTEPYQGKVGYISSGVFNSNYAWELTKKMEIGLELGFFKDRILLTSSYYRNRSNNQLQNMALPTITGPGSLVRNFPAEIQNSGLEFTLQTENIKSTSFQWSSSFNLSRNTNKLLSYPGLDESPQFNLEIGKQFYGFAYVYNFHGINPQTGLYEFTTVDGRIVSNPNDPTDFRGGRYLRINLQPAFYGGMENTFRYKRLSLDVFLQYNKQNALTPLHPFETRKNNVSIEYMNRWRNPGDNSELGKVFANIVPSDYGIALNAAKASSLAYVDASFIRLKNLSFSYDAPNLFAKKIGVNGLKLYLQGQNLATLTKYRGLDPETRSTSNLPPLRTWVLGLKISL